MNVLNPKQKRFVNFFNGDAKDAALKAGYSKSCANVTGCRLMKQKKITDAIRNRLDQKDAPLIATRKDRQVFWSKVMNDSTESMMNRLRAAELLGKSEADFTDKLEHSGNMKFEHLLEIAKEVESGRLSAN